MMTTTRLKKKIIIDELFRWIFCVYVVIVILLLLFVVVIVASIYYYFYCCFCTHTHVLTHANTHTHTVSSSKTRRIQTVGEGFVQRKMDGSKGQEEEIAIPP